MDRIERGADAFYGQLVRELEDLKREVRTLRKATPTQTPARPHPQIVEEFIGGNDTSGSIGDLGWTLAGGTCTQIAASVGRFGVRRLSTGAVAGTLAALHLGSSTTLGPLRTDDTFVTRWVVRTGTTLDANTMLRVGWGMNPEASPPADGIFFEKLLADTTWFAVCRSGGVQTRSQILTTAGAAMSTIPASRWYRLRIRRVSATAIGFTVEEPATGASYPEVLITTNITATANGLQPFFQIHNGVVGAARNFDLDFCEPGMRNLTR